MKSDNPRLSAVVWTMLGALGAGCGSGSGDTGGRALLDASTGLDGGGLGVEGSVGSPTDARQGSADAPGGLNPNVAPGGNFALSVWELQLPIGSAGDPTTIAPATLEGGFHDTYFFTDTTDGAMTFFDPEDGVTTADSSYPRSELREMNTDGTAADWAVAGTNTLSATLAVTQVPDHVCVGQIHIGTAIEAGLEESTKPLLELYYYASGAITLGIEDSPAGSQTSYSIATVPLGAKFSYTIQLVGAGTITLTVDGTPHTYTMPASFGGYGMYFKAGDYDQTADADAGAALGATVKFYALQVSH
ncbi:MAG: polysaccharide lyase family 7 protein [Polyangiaceae bacterium]